MYHSTMYHELMDESSPTKRRAHFTTPSLGELFREAEASGLSIDTVRSIESGRTVSPAFTTVARLASVLEMSLDRMSEAAQVDERDS